MKLTEEQVNFLDSFLEAGAVAAHDFSGQVHVIQFCGEELINHVSGDGTKFLERMNSSIENLTNYVKSFRTFLKVHKIPGAEDALTFGTAHSWNSHTLDIHYMKEFDHSEVTHCGDDLFPRTVVGIGFKGEKPDLEAFYPAFEHWRERENHRIAKIAAAYEAQRLKS